MEPTDYDIDEADLELPERHAIPLAPLGHSDAEHLLARERKAHVVQHRRDVVAAIDVGVHLRPRAALAHLLEAAVQVADLDVAIDDRLAVELEVELDRAVRSRMGRAHLQLHDLVEGIRDGELLLARGKRHRAPPSRRAGHGFSIGSRSGMSGWRRLCG